MGTEDDKILAIVLLFQHSNEEIFQFFEQKNTMPDKFEIFLPCYCCFGNYGIVKSRLLKYNNRYIFMSNTQIQFDKDFSSDKFIEFGWKPFEL